MISSFSPTHFARNFARIAAVVAAITATGSACAAPDGAASPDDTAGWTVEADPADFARHGYSLHVARETGHLRIEGGVYAARVPHSVHGNDGFKSSMQGAGAKVSYFFSPTRTGYFVGAGIGTVRTKIERTDVPLSTRVRNVGVGIEAGYRFDLGHGFYATPWAGVNYDVHAHDVRVGDRVYRRQPLSAVAAVHVGYRF